MLDGRAGPRDGVGDEQFTSPSYFNSLTQGVAGFSGQAMAYFDITSINNAIVSSATFSWDVANAQRSGAPDSTSIYDMANDASLSLDDFNKGPLIGTVATTGFDTGDIVTIDVTNFMRSFSGNFIGIRLVSNDPDAADRFLNMATLGSRLDIIEDPSLLAPEDPSLLIPEPGTLALFGLGLAGLGYMRRKQAA